MSTTYKVPPSPLDQAALQVAIGRRPFNGWRLATVLVSAGTVLALLAGALLYTGQAHRLADSKAHAATLAAHLGRTSADLAATQEARDDATAALGQCRDAVKGIVNVGGVEAGIVTAIEKAMGRFPFLISSIWLRFIHGREFGVDFQGAVADARACTAGTIGNV